MHNVSLVALAIAMYLTLVLEKATMDCLLDCHEMWPLACWNEYSNNGMSIINVFGPLRIAPSNGRCGKF
jgi:hypothetical protein